MPTSCWQVTSFFMWSSFLLLDTRRLCLGTVSINGRRRACH